MSSANREQVAQIAAQIGSSLMPDNAQWVNRFKVESTSSSGSYYTVAQRRTDDVWGCDCWGWKRHRRCKHLTDILHRLTTLVTQVDFAADVLEMLRSARTAYLDLTDAAPVRTPRAVPGRQLDL